MSEQNIPVELRRLVAKRAANCCEYCRTQACYSSDPFTMDHITPRSIGGPSQHENLALACHGCNQHKSKRTSALDPLTGLLVPLFHPREHGWDEHFTWNEDFTVVVGLTPTGRTTILALRLNRPGASQFASSALRNWRASAQNNLGHYVAAPSSTQPSLRLTIVYYVR